MGHRPIKFGVAIANPARVTEIIFVDKEVTDWPKPTSVQAAAFVKTGLQAARCDAEQSVSALYVRPVIDQRP